MTDIGNNSGEAADKSYSAKQPCTLPVIAYVGSSSRKANHVIGGDCCCVNASDDNDGADDNDVVDVVDGVIVEWCNAADGANFQVGPFDIDVTPVGGPTRSDHNAQVVEIRTVV